LLMERLYGRMNKMYALIHYILNLIKQEFKGRSAWFEINEPENI
jgi:hypothetical protein